MRILIVRHGVAEDRSPSGNDAARRLTPEGRRRMREAARGLKSVVESLDLIATSPLPRARETAEIVAKFFGAPLEELAALSTGGSPAAALRWLRGRKEETLAVVGHEPDLSALAGLLLTGRARSVLELKKGGACLIAFDERPAPGRGVLLWHLKPSHLRALA